MDALTRECLAPAIEPKPDPLVPTVFHTDWWLESVTGPGGWDEAEVFASGRRIGRFPYLHHRMIGGQSLCSMPPLTHFLGPAVDEGRGAACNRALKRAQITRELLDRLPRASGFYHKMHRGVTDTLVFQERGFPTSVQFTFELPPASAPVLWRGLRDKTRNVIRRAQETFEIAEQSDVDAFVFDYERNLARRGEINYYPGPVLRRAVAASLHHRQGHILSARDEAGRSVAAIFCIWDTVSAYYLLTTRDEGAGSGAVALLLWEAICRSAALGLIFDFDGVADDGSRLFFTGFGGTVQPRYIVSKYSLAHRLAGRIANPWKKRIRHRFY